MQTIFQVSGALVYVTAVRDHASRERQRGAEGRCEVPVDHPRPTLGIEVEEVASVPRRPARAGHEDVDTTQRGRSRGHHGLHGGPVRDVAVIRQHLIALIACQSDGLTRAFFVDVDAGDTGAAFGKPQRDCAPDALRRSCDDDPLRRCHEQKPPLDRQPVKLHTIVIPLGLSTRTGTAARRLIDWPTS